MEFYNNYIIWFTFTATGGCKGGSKLTKENATLYTMCPEKNGRDFGYEKDFQLLFYRIFILHSIKLKAKLLGRI